jgi:hypothetical protein
MVDGAETEAQREQAEVAHTNLNCKLGRLIAEITS